MSFIKGDLKDHVLVGSGFTLKGIVSSYFGKIIVGVRPENVSLVATADADIVAPVYAVEYTGQSAMVTVLSGQEPLAAMTSPDTRLTIGQPIGLKIARGAIYRKRCVHPVVSV